MNKVWLIGLTVLLMVSFTTMSVSADGYIYRDCGKCGTQNSFTYMQTLRWNDANGHWTQIKYTCDACSHVTYTTPTKTAHQWTTLSRYYKTADNSGHNYCTFYNCKICGYQKNTIGPWEPHYDLNRDGLCDSDCWK